MHAYKPFNNDDINYTERIVYSDIVVSASNRIIGRPGPYEPQLFNYNNNDGIFSVQFSSIDTDTLSQSFYDSVNHNFYKELKTYHAEFDFYDHTHDHEVFKEWGNYHLGQGAYNSFSDASTITLNPQHKTDWNNEGILFSVSQSLIGEGIKPGSLIIEDNSQDQIFIKDDGFGNLYASGSNYQISESSTSPTSSANYIGNVFYDLGNIVLTKTGSYKGAYDLSSISHEAEGPPMTSENNLVEGLFFKPDGKKYWMVGSAGSPAYLYEYDMTTAWDTSTATYTGRSYPVNAGARDIFFKPDGTKMYVLNGGVGNQIYEFDLVTAWDFHTAGVIQSRNISEHDGSAEGFYFRNDGLKIYMTGLDTDKVHEFNLSTAWDVKTFTDVSQSYAWSASLAAGDDGIGGVIFHPDGSRMYTTGYTQDAVYEHRLSTAWDVSTATFHTSESIKAKESNIHALQWKYDGSKMYILGHGNDTVHQYDVPSTQFYSNLGTNYTASLKSGHMIRSLEWRCVLEPEEFNLSSNPTILCSGSYTSSIIDDSRKYDWYDGSVQYDYGKMHVTNVKPGKNVVNKKYRTKVFNPYITSVGLYNNENELLLTAKLPTPLRKPKDQRIILNIQMDF